MPFPPGVSGNPSGRPKGSGSKFGARLLEQSSRKILRQLIDKAVAGDLKAIELCVDRLLPRLKARSPQVELPEAAEGSLADQGRAVLQAVFSGRLDADQATMLLAGLSTQARIIEASELEERIAALEQGIGKPAAVAVLPIPCGTQLEEEGDQ
jgi:hypothetical protein